MGHQTDVLVTLTGLFDDALQTLEEVLPTSRCRSLAITHLEECMVWAMRAALS